MFDKREAGESEDTHRRSPFDKRLWLRLPIIAVCAYILVVMLIGFFQSKLIYFPSRFVERTPSDVGLNYDDVMLATEDGVRISAWYVPRDDARTTVLLFHGNAGNNGDRIAELKTLHSLGFTTLIVDYRGFGKSDGHPSEQGTYLDAQAAWDHLTQSRGIPASSIVVLGESIGGAVAIDLASRVSAGALVVQSSFTRLADIAAIHYPLIPVRWILRHRYDSIDRVGRIKCPKLFFHSTDDSLIPIANGRALFEAAAPSKQFVETPGDHNSGGFMYSNQFAEQLRDFIDSAVAASGR